MPHDGLTSKDLDGTPSGSQACIAALLDAVQRSVRLDGGRLYSCASATFQQSIVTMNPLAA